MAVFECLNPRERGENISFWRSSTDITFDSVLTGLASLICKFYNAVMSWNNNYCNKFCPLCLRVKITFLLSWN